MYVNQVATVKFLDIFLRDEFNRILTDFQTKDYDAQKARVDANKSKYSDLDLSRVNAAHNDLKNAVNAVAFSRTEESMNSLVKASKVFSQELKTAENEMKITAAAGERLADPKKIANLQKTIKSYYNANTKMHNKFGPQFQNLDELAHVAKYEKDVNEIVKQFSFLKSAVASDGLEGRAFFSEIGRGFKQVMQFATTYGVIDKVIQELPRAMVQAVKDVNAAQIELSKVSDASSMELSSYYDEAADSAKKYGATISDVIRSTADWSRLGYGLDDAKQLSDMTTLYQKVGDNMTQESASQGLVSTLQGFQMDVGEAGSIVDKINEVANNYAIDTAGIGEALQRSAASFNASGTDLSKAIALITSSNEVIQDPTRVGNMWKTVSMRIRSAKQELQAAGEDTEGMVESSAKLRDLIKETTGFDIMADEAGTKFKDIYDIVVGIGEEWKNLTDIEQAGLLDTLAGKQHGNALAATLNNIDTLKSAYETAEFNSAGSAERELENWNKGIEASLSHLQAQFQEFSTAAISSDFFKGIVDFGSGALNVLTQVIDKFGILNSLAVGLGIRQGAQGGG